MLAIVAPAAWAPAPPAFAQPAQPAKDPKQAARELADKGYEQLQTGDYAKAIEFFRQAEALYHAPTLLLMQANAYVKLEGYVEALALYRRVADEKLAPDAPQEFRDAQAEAIKGADKLTGRIATLKIVFKGTTADKVRVTIDGVEIPTEKVLGPILQNPGNHKVEATLAAEEGGRSVFQSVTLKEGTTKQIQLVFRAGATNGPEPVPPSRGCASCEIGLPAGGSAPLEGALSLAVIGVLARLRRRRKG